MIINESKIIGRFRIKSLSFDSKIKHVNENLRRKVYGYNEYLETFVYLLED